MAVTVSIEGLDRVQRRLNKEIASIDGNIREGLQTVGLDCLAKAAPDAPVDKGDLRGSGYVTFGMIPIARADKSGSVMQIGNHKPNVKPEVEIGFGTPYAVRQHEELEWQHPRGGKAKYLEDVVKRNTTRWVQMIRDKATVR